MNVEEAFLSLFIQSFLCFTSSIYLSIELLTNDIIFYLLVQAGYNTVDSASSFTIPAASVSELSSSSNIDVTACWFFHVDGSPNRKPRTCIIV